MNRASWLPGMGRTRRTWRAWRLSVAKTVKVVSAMSAPETSGLDSQYGIGSHAASGICSIAARTR
ncbi:MAG: hypothetical protein ACR2FG_11585 [Marmoricola sp.]